MKTVKIKSAIPLYLAALVWILFGLFSPIYRLIYTEYLSLSIFVTFSLRLKSLLSEITFPSKSTRLKTMWQCGLSVP